MKTQIAKIFEIFEKDNPNPKTELEYTNNFTLLMAVVLSAQATDKGVNLATKALFETYDHPQKILDLGLEGLKTYTKTLNYYPTKSKNIIALSEILMKEYDGEVPNNIDDLVKLPGVGRKTANVILGVAFDQPSMPVDTHVFRVSTRLGIAKAPNADKMEEALCKIVPKHLLYKAHHWFVLHGRYVCKAKKPLCEECKLREFCKYNNELSSSPIESPRTSS
jgi:endonuclease-3